MSVKIISSYERTRGLGKGAVTERVTHEMTPTEAVVSHMGESMRLANMHPGSIEGRLAQLEHENARLRAGLGTLVEALSGILPNAVLEVLCGLKCDVHHVSRDDILGTDVPSVKEILARIDVDVQTLTDRFDDHLAQRVELAHWSAK